MAPVGLTVLTEETTRSSCPGKMCKVYLYQPKLYLVYDYLPISRSSYQQGKQSPHGGWEKLPGDTQWRSCLELW